jgi:hypothetical protein
MASKSKAHIARTIALYRARQSGWLEGRSYMELGARLSVHRATIMRNVRDLDGIDELVEEYLAALAPRIKTKPPQ